MGELVFGPAPCGGVVEWLMAPVLKTGDPQGSVGSNPTPSVPQDSVTTSTLRLMAPVPAVA
jgi:hypothetical protein